MNHIEGADNPVTCPVAKQSERLKDVRLLDFDFQRRESMFLVRLLKIMKNTQMLQRKAHTMKPALPRHLALNLLSTPHNGKSFGV